MNLFEDWTTPGLRAASRSPRARRALEALAFTAAGLVISTSAILAKEATHAPVLTELSDISDARAQSPRVTPVSFEPPAPQPTPVRLEDAEPEPAWPADTRWFDARPVRPARTITMVVTAYSPDAASCGDFADGQTATLHAVTTNAGQLVAADPRLLPYGSMLTIEGYASGEVVPVLDCGGAIKGNRLDLLFPTHAEALEWGVRTIEVTVWEYADGKPATNPRLVR